MIPLFFRYKDYRDGARQKTMSLSAVDFLQRFCLHILPSGFIRIRHYGILSTRRKSQCQEDARLSLGAVAPLDSRRSGDRLNQFLI